MAQSGPLARRSNFVVLTRAGLGGSAFWAHHKDDLSRERGALLILISQDSYYTIVPLKLDFAAEKGGMAVSAVWRLVCFLAPSPSDRSTQARRAVPLY